MGRYTLPTRTFALPLLLTGLFGYALADTGVPLYVANAGTDQGDCSDSSQPCQSIGYALSVAGKNAKIRVAGGTYALDNPEDAIYIVSGAVDVTGGHNAGAAAAGESRQSVLTGVPLELRERFRERGFHVIVDSKGDSRERDALAESMVFEFQRAQVSAMSAPCVGGQASGFACDSIDLLSHVALTDFSATPAEAMDVWGFVDLNTHREYVFVGVSIGTAVLDVTDPTAPVEVGFIDGQNANWRDVKAFQFFDAATNRWRAYAYVTTDGAQDGLFVIDLGGLPHSIQRVSYASDFTNAHNVYVSGVDFATGVQQAANEPQIIVAGSGVNVGQFRTYTLGDPAQPLFVQRVANAGYMHDAASTIIDGPRAAQCAGAPATCDVLVDFNEEQIEFWDINNPASPNLISRAAVYADTGYVHSGWWTEDKQFVFGHDELDERDASLQTTVRVFSLADLTTPSLVGTWTGSTDAIDHNGFVRGNRYYMSNYTRGLTILDISDPTTPTEAGFFDTFGANNATQFAGAWGAFPFLPSGTVAISDINSGLYLVADQTRDVAQGSLTFSASSFAAAEGQQAQLGVERVGGTTGAASVDYEVLATTASANDTIAQTGTLSWADGDATPQVIAIDVVDDAMAEPMEHAIVRLVNPAGGATLGDTGSANLYISDAGAAGEVSVFADAVDVAERGFGRAIVVMQRTGDAQGAASIDFAISGGDAVAATDFDGPTSGTLSWDAGDAVPQSIEFTITDDGVAEADEFFEITFSNAQGATLAGPATARVTVRDGAGSNAAPNAVAGMSQTVAENSQVVLDGSMSNDPNGDALTFAWTQTSGAPTVTLQNAATATASFTAPGVNSDTLLQFRLDVNDPGGLTSSATVSVTVTNSGGGGFSGNSGGGGGSGSTAPLALLLLGGFAWRRVSRRDCGE